MTQDDMGTVVDYYLREADPRDVVVDEGLDVQPHEVQDLLIEFARYIETGIGKEYFDE
jgi:hypothetical protein